ncbi:MAG: radical SAM protein [Oscillospiraceae bacterium]|nr:radical SAM protein [Oscillospiraceae bacterium]
MLKRAYVEITNVCNLRCAFCPGTRRAPRTMSPEEFDAVLDALEGRVSYVYLHLMGEPLLHPRLDSLLASARAHGMKVCLTTNGTLLAARAETLLSSGALYRVAVSLHSIEENGGDVGEARQYLESVWSFAVRAAECGVIVALRLWNEGAADAGNGVILDFLREKTGVSDWPEPRARSFRLAENLYLERERAFEWPDLGAAETHTEFCRALREQIGILADGTVVPCCLDHEGDLALGNIFEQGLGEILAGERAAALFDGFSRRVPAEELCRRCGYALRFNAKKRAES